LSLRLLAEPNCSTFGSDEGLKKGVVESKGIVGSGLFLFEVMIFILLRSGDGSGSSSMLI
jgi:hypothetical protein